MSKLVIPALSLLLAIGCSGRPKSADKVEDQEIQGHIADRDWTLVSGTATVDPNGGFDVRLYAEEVGCNDPWPEGDYVLFGAPEVEGEWELQLNLFNLDEARTVTFFDGVAGSNIIVGKGLYAIQSLTAETLELVMYADGKDSGELEGRSTIDICGDGM